MTIDRAQEAVQETPFLTQAALPKRAVDHLAAPAQETVNHQEQEREAEPLQRRDADRGEEHGVTSQPFF